jgi:hypothetical protein
MEDRESRLEGGSVPPVDRRAIDTVALDGASRRVAFSVW